MSEVVRWPMTPSPPPPRPLPPGVTVPAIPYRPRSPNRGRDILKRQWLYGTHLVRGYVSATISPGGLGKSSLVLVEALAMASGRPLLGVQVRHPLRVWSWNGEDPLEEQERRFDAAAMRFGLTGEMIGERVNLTSGRDVEIKIAGETRDGALVFEPVVNAVKSYIRDNRIDVVQVDPFVSSHAVNENDNNAVDAVVKAWARIAQRCQCAVELVHHSRKPATGTRQETSVDDARGAGALVAATRSARTLNRMTRKEAEALGVDEPDRKAHVRIDTGKSNLAPAGSATWFKLESEWLDNGIDGESGVSVAVATPWTPPSLFDGVSTAHTAQVQAGLTDAEEAGEHFLASSKSPRWAGVLVCQILGLDHEAPADRRRAEALLKAWLETGVVREADAVVQKRRRAVILSGARI